MSKHIRSVTLWTENEKNLKLKFIVQEFEFIFICLWVMSKPPLHTLSAPTKKMKVGRHFFFFGLCNGLKWFNQSNNQAIPDYRNLDLEVGSKVDLHRKFSPFVKCSMAARSTKIDWSKLKKNQYYWITFQKRRKTRSNTHKQWTISTKYNDSDFLFCKMNAQPAGDWSTIAHTLIRARAKQKFPFQSVMNHHAIPREKINTTFLSLCKYKSSKQKENIEKVVPYEAA